MANVVDSIERHYILAVQNAAVNLAVQMLTGSGGRMKGTKVGMALMCLAVGIAGCSDESSGPAPEAFTNCMRHFTDDNVVGSDAAAAAEVCKPFADEANEAVQRLAEKHFQR